MTNSEPLYPIDPRLTADEIRRILDLAPHPEGGWYRETFRDEPSTPGVRGTATAIYFLLAAGESSALHRIDAVEIWLWHEGATLELIIGGNQILLGPNLANGETLQAFVPAQIWQAARSTGAWTLVTCIVAPAFSFSGFEMSDGKTSNFHFLDHQRNQPDRTDT